MSRPLFVGSYLQVKRWVLAANENEGKNAFNDSSIYQARRLNLEKPLSCLADFAGLNKFRSYKPQ